MLEERLHKIITSVGLQKSSDPEAGSLIKGADSINISLQELMILTGVFSDIFPEEVKSFAEALSPKLEKISSPQLSALERADREAETAELLETNKSPLSYLNSLNRLLIAADDRLNDPEQLTHSFDISRDLAPSFRYDYIEKLAEAHVRGNDSDSIQYLLTTKNNIFYESRSFFENVKVAIVSMERKQLKNKMQLLDELELFDLPGSAVKVAVTLSERERLKELMRKIDLEQEDKVRHLHAVYPSAAVKRLPGPTIITSSEKKRFTWKRYAVAAGIVGLIAIASVMVYNDKRSHFNIAANEPGPADTNGNSSPRPEKTNMGLVNYITDTAETILTVRKEEVLGFAAKLENITVRVYRITGKIPATPALQKEADSTSSLNKMYSFKGNVLSFYLATGDRPEVYKIDNRYYLKLGGSVYQFRPSEKLTRLTRINDKNISDRIDKINYQRDNK